MSLSQRAWAAYLAALERYHRYEVQGLDTLVAAMPCIAVGYHGRGLPMDLAMLTRRVWRATGRWPRPVVHHAMHLPPAWPLIRSLGGISGDLATVRAVLDRGDLVFIAPGGTHEALRPFADRYRVDWGRRRGYLRLAGATGAPIVPVASDGVDDTYLGLNDGDAWGRRLRLPVRLPFWVALGPAGLWPLSPPFPVRIRTRVGAPIAVDVDGPPRPEDPVWIEAMHVRVTTAVQTLLDELRATRTTPSGG